MIHSWNAKRLWFPRYWAELIFGKEPGTCLELWLKVKRPRYLQDGVRAYQCHRAHRIHSYPRSTRMLQFHWIQRTPTAQRRSMRIAVRRWMKFTWPQLLPPSLSYNRLLIASIRSALVSVRPQLPNPRLKKLIQPFTSKYNKCAEPG